MRCLLTGEWHIRERRVVWCCGENGAPTVFFPPLVRTRALSAVFGSLTVLVGGSRLGARPAYRGAGLPVWILRSLSWTSRFFQFDFTVFPIQLTDPSFKFCNVLKCPECQTCVHQFCSALEICNMPADWAKRLVTPGTPALEPSPALFPKLRPLYFRFELCPLGWQLAEVIHQI